MKTFDVSDIRSWKPCYDPTKYLAESWQGTALDILDNKAIPFKDRLWVVLRPELVSVECMKRYALACARSCEYLSTDARVKACNDATEAYLDGHITVATLRAAGATADSAWAARATAWAATADSAWAARATADSAGAMAWAAAWAAGATAWAAAWAARATADSAGAMAWAAAWATADTGVSEDELIDKLKDFILDEQLASDERC